MAAAEGIWTAICAAIVRVTHNATGCVTRTATLDVTWSVAPAVARDATRRVTWRATCGITRGVTQGATCLAVNGTRNQRLELRTRRDNPHIHA